MLKEDKNKHPLSPNQGRDELNLAIFPIALLTDKATVSREEQVIEVVETGTDQEGRPIERKWTVIGSNKYGLPVSSDNEILMCLLELTKEKTNFEGRNVPVSCYEIVKRMGWRDEGKNYHRVKEGLTRLKGVTIVSENAFWNKKVRRHATMSFGIIDDFHLTSPKLEAEGKSEDQTGNKSEDKSEDKEAAGNYVAWNQVLFQSFRDGNLKYMDLALWRLWRYPITKRLHRYLDRQFYWTNSFQIEISRLAALIPLPKSQAQYPSSIKRQIAKAADELLKAGYITGVKYLAGANGEHVVFTRNRKGNPEFPEPVLAEYHSVLKRLQERGIRESRALELLEKADPIFISDWLDHLDYIENLKKPVAYLVKAIEEKWQVPPYAVQARNKAKSLELKKQIEKEEEQRAFEEREEFLKLPPEEKAETSLQRWMVLEKALRKRDPSPEEIEKKRLELVEEYRNFESPAKEGD